MKSTPDTIRRLRHLPIVITNRAWKVIGENVSRKVWTIVEGNVVVAIGDSSFWLDVHRAVWNRDGESISTTPKHLEDAYNSLTSQSSPYTQPR